MSKHPNGAKSTVKPRLLQYLAVTWVWNRLALGSLPSNAWTALRLPLVLPSRENSGAKLTYYLSENTVLLATAQVSSSLRLPEIINDGAVVQPGSLLKSSIFCRKLEIANKDAEFSAGTLISPHATCFTESRNSGSWKRTPV